MKTTCQQVAMIVLGWVILQAITVVACGGAESNVRADTGPGGGSTSQGVGSGGDAAACGCAQPEIVEVPCVMHPNIGMTGEWPSAVLKVPGRDQASLIGTQAIAKNAPPYKLSTHDGASTDYVATVPLYREDTVVVDCAPLGTTISMYDSVKFIIPPPRN